jgi:hypothetical protein
MIFDPPVYTLRDFQKSHNLSFLQFHKLSEIGLAPRTILIGDKANVPPVIRIKISMIQSVIYYF